MASSSTVLRAPIPLPDRRYSEPPVRPPPLDPESVEAKKLKEVHEHFAVDGYELESDGARSPLSDEEKMYLTQELFLRFLKATKWNVASAIKRIEGCMQFRRANNLYDLRGVLEEIRPEWASGKSVVLGYTRKCQPIYYTWTSKNDQPPSQRAVKHMMYSMERVMDLMPAGVETILFSADLSGKTQTSSGAMGVSSQILSNMQNHYPERLGAACPVNVPWLGSLFMTLLLPFVDSHTRSKIWVNPDFTKELIAPEQLLREYGGHLDFEFSEAYIDALVDLCIERRAANLQRWKAAGGVVGLSEWDILEPVAAAPA